MNSKPTFNEIIKRFADKCVYKLVVVISLKLNSSNSSVTHEKVTNYLIISLALLLQLYNHC